MPRLSHGSMGSYLTVWRVNEMKNDAGNSERNECDRSSCLRVEMRGHTILRTAET